MTMLMIKETVYFLAVLLFLLSSCSKDKETKPGGDKPQENFVRDLNNGNISTGQPSGIAKPIYFSLQKHSEVKANAEWDLAFTGLANTLIVSNSKVGTWMKILNADYDKIDRKPSLSYSEAESGNIANAENGWYKYDVQTHVVEPIKGKTIFIRTGNGRYYKIKMISIYEGAPAYPTSSDKTTFLTFQYAELK